MYYRWWLNILWQSLRLWVKTRDYESWEIALYLIVGNYIIISGHARVIRSLLH